MRQRRIQHAEDIGQHDLVAGGMRAHVGFAIKQVSNDADRERAAVATNQQYPWAHVSSILRRIGSRGRVQTEGKVAQYTGRVGGG